MPQSLRKPVEDPAIDAGGFLLRVGLVILAVAVPVSVILSRRALFSLVPIGTAIVLIGGLMLPHTHLRGRLRAMGATAPALSGIGLLAWAALSIAWTPFPAEAAARLWKTGGTLALVAFTVALLPERTRTSNIYLFPLGLVAAVVATIAVMALSPQPLLAMQTGDSTPERAALTLVTLVWPAIGALAVRDRWVAAAGMAVAVAVAAVAAWTSTALAALAIGALAFAIATWDPARVARGMGAIAVVLFLLAPLLPFALLKPFDMALDAGLGLTVPPLVEVAASARIWADLVRAEPLRLVTGHGFDMMSHAVASGFIPGPAPRSILFETWYELGVVGAVLAAAFAAGAFAAVGRASPTVAPFLLAELAAAATVALWGLDTTQLWWVTFLGVATLAFVHVVRGQYKTDRPAAAVLTSNPNPNPAR